MTLVLSHNLSNWQIFRALVHELHEEIVLENPGSSTRPNSDMVPIPENPEEDILTIVSHEDFESEL